MLPKTGIELSPIVTTLVPEGYQYVLNIREMFGVLESSVDGIKLGILDNNEKYHILVETSDYLIKYPYIYITPKGYSKLLSYRQDLIINLDNTELFSKYLQPIQSDIQTSSGRQELKYRITFYSVYDLDTVDLSWIHTYIEKILIENDIGDIENDINNLDIYNFDIPIILSDKNIFLLSNSQLYSRNNNLYWISPYLQHRKQFLLIRQQQTETSVPQRFDVQFSRFKPYLYDEHMFVPKSIRIYLKETVDTNYQDILSESYLHYRDFNNIDSYDISQNKKDKQLSGQFIYDEPLFKYSSYEKLKNNDVIKFNENDNTNYYSIILQYFQTVFDITDLDTIEELMTIQRNFNYGIMGALKLYNQNIPELNSTNNIVGFINYFTRELLFTYNRFIPTQNIYSPLYQLNLLNLYREYYFEYLYLSQDKYYGDQVIPISDSYITNNSLVIPFSNILRSYQLDIKDRFFNITNVEKVMKLNHILDEILTIQIS